MGTYDKKSKRNIICYIIIAVLLCTNILTGSMMLVLSQHNKTIAADVESLNNVIKEKEETIAEKDSCISQQANRLLEMIQEQEQREKTTNRGRTCKFDGCNMIVMPGDQYCNIHKCHASGCYNASIGSHSSYCEYHKCKEPSCPSAAYRYGYCVLHNNM